MNEYQCPKCGAQTKDGAHFSVGAYMTVTLNYDGVGSTDSDCEWDKDSPFSCLTCQHDGKAGEFNMA